MNEEIRRPVHIENGNRRCTEKGNQFGMDTFKKTKDCRKLQ